MRLRITITTDADREKWMTILSDCEAALVKLTLGKSVVSVETPEDKVAFTPASAGQLRKLIADIRIALGLQKRARPQGKAFSFG